MTQPYDITDDSELRTAVRDLTQYSSNHLSTTELKGVVRAAKRLLATELQVDPNWYADRGLTEALLGVACIEAKCAVENDAVASYDFGQGVTVDARDSDGESLQVARFENRIETGLQRADTDRDVRYLGNTTAFIG